MPGYLSELQSHLLQLGACYASRNWAGDRTAKQAWEECTTPEWLYWWVVKDGAQKRRCVEVSFEILQTIIHLTTTPEVLETFGTIRKWLEDPCEENMTAMDQSWVKIPTGNMYGSEYLVNRAVCFTAMSASLSRNNPLTDGISFSLGCAPADEREQKQVEYCNIIRRLLHQPWTETPGGIVAINLEGNA